MIVPFGTMVAAFLAAMLAYYFLGRREALLRALLPGMLLVSFSFTFQISQGLPLLTVYSTMCLVTLAAVWYIDRPPLQWQPADFLVLLYMLAQPAAMMVTSGPKPAVLDLSSSVVNILPSYILFRVAVPKDEVPRFLAAFVAVVLVASVLSPLEAFLHFKITAPLQAIWPSWASANDFMRSGFNRVASAYGHPIHAGMLFTLSAMFTWFLFLSRRIGKPTRWLILLVLFGMAIFLTGSRSAYAFSVPMLAMVYFHFSRRQVAYGVTVVTILVLVLLVVLPIYESYASTTDYANADETQTSVMYRKQMMENYVQVVLSKPMTGWGVQLPVIDGQGSIDNYYLLMSLLYGIPVTVLFWTIGAWAVLRGAFVYFRKLAPDHDRGVIWLLIAGLVFVAICASVVWLTGQALLSYFLMVALLTTLTEPKAPPRPGAGLRWV